MNFSKTAKVAKKSPSQRYMASPGKKANGPKGRKTFGHQKTMSPGRKKMRANETPENAPERNPTFGSPKLVADQSYDTYGLENEDSVSQNNQNPLSGVSQDEEKIENLLERLEESRMPEKGFSIEERNLILEDTQNLATLCESDTLHRIFQLMCNAQENFKNHEESFKSRTGGMTPNDKRDVKMTFDLEFEKLLLMLKAQYHSLFDKRKLKGKIQENTFENESDQDTDSDSEQAMHEENSQERCLVKIKPGSLLTSSPSKFASKPSP